LGGVIRLALLAHRNGTKIRLEKQGGNCIRGTTLFGGLADRAPAEGVIGIKHFGDQEKEKATYRCLSL
jgi:hypothetical protein